MSALERPSEVLLVALFHEPVRAEAAAKAVLHTGLDADRVAVLARDARGPAFAAVPRAVSLRLTGVGRVVARGMLARELAAGPVGELGRLGTALRRLGLSATDVPRLERAIRRRQIVVLAAVPLVEAPNWGRLLQKAGAVALSARPRLGAWPLFVVERIRGLQRRPPSHPREPVEMEPRDSEGGSQKGRREGGRMLRTIVATAGAALLVTATAARPARAMTDRELVKAHVPFAFRVAGQQMPPGDYELKPIDLDHPAVIEIRRAHGDGSPVVVLGIPKESGAIHEAQMTFDDVGSERFLRAVLLPGESGVEFPIPGAEVRAAHTVAAGASRAPSASEH